MPLQINTPAQALNADFILPLSNYTPVEDMDLLLEIQS